jgi:hypothetical protein
MDTGDLVLAVVVALATGGGAAAGASLSARATRKLEGERFEREERRRAGEEEKVVVQAARLLRYELLNLHGTFSAMLEWADESPSVRRVPLDLAAWKLHQADLARAADETMWQQVSAAYGALEIANRREGDSWSMLTVRNLHTLTGYAGGHLRKFLDEHGRVAEHILGQTALDAILRGPYSREDEDYY